MLGIALADDAGHALSLDDLAVLANRLDAGTNLHALLRARLRTSCPIYQRPESHASGELCPTFPSPTTRSSTSRHPSCPSLYPSSRLCCRTSWVPATRYRRCSSTYPRPGLDLPGRPDHRLDLLALDHEVREQGCRLLRPQRHGRVGPGQLDQQPGALGDEGLGIVSVPGPAGLLRRPGQLRLLSRQAPGARASSSAVRRRRTWPPPEARAAPPRGRRPGAPGARPPGGWRPAWAASRAPATRTWSPVASPARRIPGTTTSAPSGSASRTSATSWGEQTTP